jgi:hypothetical protein
MKLFSLAALLFASTSILGCADAPSDEPDETGETAQALNGDTWKTVDNNGYTEGTTPGLGASYASVTVSQTTSKVFVVGYRIEQSGATTWIARGSATGAVGSFALNHTFSLGGNSRATASVSDAAGHTFIAGEAIDANGTPHWIVIRTADNGASWTIVVNRAFAGYTHAMPTSMAIDGNDQVGIFITGQLVHPSGQIDEFTQRAPSGTAAFVDYAPTAGFETGVERNGLCSTWSGTAMVGTHQAPTSAWLFDVTTHGHTTWDYETYQSTGAGNAAYGCSYGNNVQTYVAGTFGGTTWVVDAYGITPTAIDHVARSFANTAARAVSSVEGRCFVAGSYGTSATSSTWHVRSTLATAWFDSDDFSLAAGKLATANAIAHDGALITSNGTFYVAGDAVDATGRRHGIVRRIDVP